MPRGIGRSQFTPRITTMDDDYYDPMYDGGDECYCSECGEEAEPGFALKHEGMCEDCWAATGDEERAAEQYEAEMMGEELIDGVGFADPGGRSALRAATRDNPRIHPCPTCGTDNVLTPADVARGYQCNRCADMAERGF